MKKIFALIGLGAFTITGASAQHITIGPEAGVNIYNQTTEIDGDRFRSDPKLGLKIGGVLDIGLNRTVSLQPGLFYSQKGSKLEDIYYESVGGVTYREMERYDTRLNYLEMPLNIQFYFGRPRRGYFFIGGGPYVALALGGHEDYRFERRLSNGNREIVDSDRDSYDLEIGDNSREDDVKGTDAGLTFNLGFMSRHGFFMRGNLGVGLSNIFPGGDSDYRQHNIGGSITMGFLFGNY